MYPFLYPNVYPKLIKGDFSAKVYPFVYPKVCTIPYFKRRPQGTFQGNVTRHTFFERTLREYQKTYHSYLRNRLRLTTLLPRHGIPANSSAPLAPPLSSPASTQRSCREFEFPPTHHPTTPLLSSLFSCLLIGSSKLELQFTFFTDSLAQLLSLSLLAQSLSGSFVVFDLLAAFTCFPPQFLPLLPLLSLCLSSREVNTTRDQPLLTLSVPTMESGEAG